MPQRDLENVCACQRILENYSCCTKNDAYRHILAITFTNKAVHEMKSRIVGSLSEFAKDEPSAKAQDLMQDLSIDTELSIIQIKTKSQQIIKHIIHNYAAFDISTIDKFTHKVIRAFAHDLNLPMTFEVTLDTENLLIEAVDAIIAQAGEDETLTKLLIDFTMEKPMMTNLGIFLEKFLKRVVWF
jgi:ATP-dependent exoDNAse (exonuclease V) beta subunit